MRKMKIFGIVTLAFLMLCLAMPFARCEPDGGSVTVIVSSDDPITIIANGDIVPSYTIIKKTYNPIRLKQRLNELANTLDETTFYLCYTMDNLNKTMHYLDQTASFVHEQGQWIYNAELKIGDLEANFNETTIELQGFEEYTEEQLNALFDGIADLRSELRMEIAALNERVGGLETRTTNLEAEYKKLKGFVDFWHPLYVLGILVSFALLGGIFVGVWKSRK